MKKIPDINKRFKALRELKGMSQAELAKRFKISRSAVSLWEIGPMPPPAEALMLLGNLATYPENVWFWKLAGLDDQVMLSAAESMLKERGKAPPGSKLTRVPMLSMGSRGKAGKGGPILLPGSLVPNPGSTRYIGLEKNSVGKAFVEGDIVVVDSFESQRDPMCPAPFWERLIVVKMSAASEGHPNEGRFWREGMVIGRLRLAFAQGFLQGFAWAAYLHLSQDLAGEEVALGQWAERLSPEKLRQLDVPGNKKLEDAALQESEKRAYEKLRLYDGCEIIGEVILVIPAKAKAQFRFFIDSEPQSEKGA
jgi:transcriptional regulator with XRE-family HTH domain